jgi:hypothetical protein
MMEICSKRRSTKWLLIDSATSYSKKVISLEISSQKIKINRELGLCIFASTPVP